MPSPLQRGLALLIGCFLAAIAAAQPYPDRPVRLIIPFPPGGSNDVVGRVIGVQLGERLGQPVIIDNRGGAGGTIGMNAGAKAPADGYTLLLVSVAYPVSIALGRMPRDSIQSFAPVAALGTGPSLLVVPAGTPAPVMGRLQKEIFAILDSADTKKRFELEGAEVLRITPLEFGQLMAAETAKWSRVVNDAGIKAE
jgi:tripartite-type tricarboxylate transporter receptor subunit TctC